MVFDGEIPYCNEWCHSQSKVHTHYAEHNDIEIPQFLRGPGWEDRSYHNDTCARSEYDLPDGQRIIPVCVEHDDPAKREVDHKYTVYIINAEDQAEVGSEHYEGDSAEEAAAVIARLIQEASK
jgi:hypothetical protein